MKYALDANTCINFLNGRNPSLRARLLGEPAANIVICCVVKAELFFGSYNSRTPERNLAEQRQFFSRFNSAPFDDAAAEIYGEIRSHLKRVGTPIGPNDLLIASIALANNLTLVTHNSAEFGRVPHLSMEDWE